MPSLSCAEKSPYAQQYRGGVSEFTFFTYDLRMAFMIALFWEKVKGKFTSPSGIEPLLSG